MADDVAKPCDGVHVWAHDGVVAFAKAVLAAEERGVLQDVRVTEDRTTYGHPMHFEVRTTDESGKALRPFNDVWTCPPWPREMCGGGG